MNYINYLNHSALHIMLLTTFSSMLHIAQM